MSSHENRSSKTNTGKAVLGLAFIMVVIQILSDALIEERSYLDSVATAVLAAIATLALRRQSRFSPDIVAICLIGQVIVMTASFRGHAWQIDTHMVYFVMLAGISTMGSIRAMLVGAGVTAAHHLGLTVFMPAMVYPSADLSENLMRTALHGTLVVFETGVLAISMLRDNRMVTQITNQSESLADQSHRAEIAESKARTMMAEAEQAIVILRANLHRLSERSLDCRIVDDIPEAFEDLRSDFNLAVEQLDTTLGKALDMAQSFDCEARLLADLIKSLEMDTQSQATGLGTQSEQVEKLSARLGEAAAHAKRAAERVATARNEADQGGEITKQAVAAMERIEKSSGEVGNIMDLIDDIAFQTNLLALNAGVEAARAGTSGRGFAVVAGEVQALSQRTAEAARGVKELISSSEEEVASGARLVHDAGNRLSMIVQHVNEVNTLIEEIQVDADNRAEEMASLSQQMSGLDSEAQKIIGQSAEMASSGLRLRSHAAELSDLMKEFEVSSLSMGQPKAKQV
ncbi:methyl-accepting chemotaxis protein [Primorskyibacter sp. 2E107]|uniref:methyl-accepting chemotaxis protein n=1 Tax=Primorskyibacter sp. 2E107 TaxID=3403458 RepID=UPI003AF8E8D5